MNSRQPAASQITRRYLFGKGAYGLGIAALARLLGEEIPAQRQEGRFPHFSPRVKRVVYLFQSGAPSQIDTLDYKPGLAALTGQDLPDSVRQGQRLTAMTATQSSFPIAPSIFEFRQHGQTGAWISELMPHTAGIADKLCIVRSMHTEAINHDPAVTFFQTGRAARGSTVDRRLGLVRAGQPES